MKKNNQCISWFTITLMSIIIILSCFIAFRKKEVQIIEKQVEVDNRDDYYKLQECLKTNSKLVETPKKCWDYNCMDVVYFMNWDGIATGYITLYAPQDEVKQWVIGTYWVNWEKTMKDDEYIWPEFILPKTYVFKSKKELLNSIK